MLTGSHPPALARPHFPPDRRINCDVWLSFLPRSERTSPAEETTPDARLLYVRVSTTPTSLVADAQERRLSDCSSATGLRSAGHFVTPLPDQTSSPPTVWEHPRLAVPNYMLCSTSGKGFQNHLALKCKNNLRVFFIPHITSSIFSCFMCISILSKVLWKWAAVSCSEIIIE